VLVHVAFAVLALTAFTTFVVDYGVFWLARRQAQNSADGGALAGAIALAFDAPGDFTDTGPAKQGAYLVTQQNLVYGAVPSVNVTSDITFPACPPGSGGGTCVRVDVFRNPARNNALPMFFGSLVGLAQQGVQATATAQVSGANSARCMLPWVLADRWADVFDDNIDTTTYPNDGDSNPITAWSPNDTYQQPNGDYYNAPYVSGHTGWTTAGDFGRQLNLHRPVGQFSAGWANIVDLPPWNGESSGANFYRNNIAGCNGNTIGIASPTEDCSGYPNSGTTPQQALAGCLGAQTGWINGPTTQGVSGPGGPPSLTPITQQDPGAQWSWSVNAGPNGQAGGVVDGSGNLNMSSPRIRPIAVLDITHYMNNPGCNQGGTGCVAKVINIVGFFVEGVCSTLQSQGRLDPGISCDPDSNANAQVVGRIVTLPGSLSGAGSPVSGSSFINVVRLVR
jgi:hypothetical protein